jgi:small subunit ribosomal protein S3
MSHNSTIRKFIDRNVERHLVREFLLSKTERAGFGGLDFQRTPEGTKVTLSAERVGMVIGRKGKIINELQRRLQDFNITNPRLEVAEIETPELNAQVMASKLASALERGWYFRRAGHSTLLNIMDKGAKGCLVVLSGKLTGSRNRTQKFQAGHIKYCGDTAIQFMDIGKSVCVKKLGTIGCTVAIMRPGSKLPHEIEIKSRHEVGLSPLVDVLPTKEVSEDLPEPIVEEVPEGEILEETIEEEPEAEGVVEVAVEAVKDTAGEVVEGIVDVAGEVVEAVKETGGAAIDAAKDVVGEVVEAASEIVEELAEGDVIGAAAEVVEGVVEVTEAAVEGAIDTAKEVVEGVVEVATEVVDSAKDISSEVVEGVKDVVEEILGDDSESEEEATE